MSDFYEFFGQDSNLDNGSDCFDQTTATSGTVPGPTDVALIEYGQSLTGTLNVATLLLEQASDGPSLSLTGASTQVTATVGVVAGTVVLENGAGWTVDTLEIVGGGTSLILQNGASVYGDSPDEASITVGTTSGASLLSIDGLNTNFEYSSAGGSLLVGAVSSSSATVSVTDGGAIGGTYNDVLIGAADGATATMLISGAASVVELNAAVDIGDYGTGSLLIQKGGYASLGGGLGVSIGGSADGSPVSGEATITGAGSLLSDDGILVVGAAGTSTAQVLVSAGGEVQVADDTYIEGGTLSVTGAGSVFESRTVTVNTGSAQPGLSVSSGGSVSIVTLDLTSGRVALAGGDLTVRRSAFISAGAVVSGAGTVAAGITYNSGLLSAAGGTLVFIGAVEQTGASRIAAAATLQFDGAVGSGQSVLFAAAGGTLALGDAAGFVGSIAGFAQGETIDLLGDTVTGLSLRGGVLTAKDGNAIVARLALKGSHAIAGFKMASDGHGGTDITYSAGNVVGHIWKV